MGHTRTHVQRIASSFTLCKHPLTPLLLFCAPSHPVRFLPRTLDLGLHRLDVALTLPIPPPSTTPPTRQVHAYSCRASREPALSRQPGPVMRGHPQSGLCLYRHRRTARRNRRDLSGVSGGGLRQWRGPSASWGGFFLPHFYPPWPHLLS